MKPYIYVTRKLPEASLQRLRQKFEVGMWPEEALPVPEETLLQAAKRADALLTVVSDPVGSNLFEVAEKLKIIANMGVGYDNIDVEAASSNGIIVTNTPDVLSETTADLTFALLLAAARRVVEAAEYVKAGKWESWSPFLLAGQDIHHKTIGICGMGNIGQAVARRAKGFGMEILYYNRSRKREAEKEIGARYCGFDQLVEDSDYLVAMTPLTEDTRHLFNEEVFKRMKNTAIFINASRGAVADEAALVSALKNGEIAGAGLDVFDQEPIGPEHPLLSLPNVVALPHIGSATMETRLKMIDICIDNIERVITGRVPVTAVNQSILNG